MTTIPKPIMTSDWNFWRINKVNNEKIIWETHGYDAIVDYLSNRLAKILSEEIEGIQQGHDCMLIQIRVKRNADIHQPTSWNIGLRFERKILMEGMMKKFAKGVRGVEDDKELNIKGLGKFNLNDLAIQFSLLDDFEAEYKKNIEIYKSAIRSIVNYNLIEQNYLEE